MSANHYHPPHGGYPGNIEEKIPQSEPVLQGEGAQDLADALEQLDTTRASRRVLYNTPLEAAHYEALIHGLDTIPTNKDNRKPIRDLIALMESRAKPNAMDVSAGLVSQALELVRKHHMSAVGTDDVYVQAAKICIKRCASINDEHFALLNDIPDTPDMPVRLFLAEAMIDQAPMLTMLRRSKKREFTPEYSEKAITAYDRWMRGIEFELSDAVYTKQSAFGRMARASDMRYMANDALTAEEFCTLAMRLIDKERRFISTQGIDPENSYTRALLHKIEQERIQACMHGDDMQAYVWRVIRSKLAHEVREHNGYYIDRSLQAKFFPEVKLPEAKGPTPDPRAQEYARGR